MAARTQPLIAIVGPTASGKTALALELAEKYNGEIICADSRTIYKGMDIGTAKPTLQEQRRVPHHLLDIVEPGETFSVAKFQQLAQQAIDEIRSRGNTPFLVGGTGLYIDSIIFDYNFSEIKPDKERRQELADLSTIELQDYCIKHNIELPENRYNARYLVRAIEQGGINRNRYDRLIPHSIVVGIATDIEILKQRIAWRAEQIFASNAVNEATSIGRRYGWKTEAMTGNIYRLAEAIAHEEMSIDEAKQKFKTLDWRLAKRQLTWFRRNKFIHWGSAEEIKQRIETYLDASEHATIEHDTYTSENR